MKKLLTIFLLAGIETAFAAPETFSISLGAWEYGIDGTVRSNGSSIDVFEQNEPGLDVQAYAQLPFESFGSPALRARYLDVSARSDERFNDDREVFGLDVAAGSSELDLDIDVEFFDLYLLWDWGEELLITAGAGIKSVDAEADATVVTTVTTTAPPLPPSTSRRTDKASEDFGFVIPALFLGAGYQISDLLRVQAEVDGLGDGDNQFIAGQVLVRITPWQNIGVDLGWRLVDIQGEAGDSRLDVGADGPFLGAVVEFGGG